MKLGTCWFRIDLGKMDNSGSTDPFGDSLGIELPDTESVMITNDSTVFGTCESAVTESGPTKNVEFFLAGEFVQNFERFVSGVKWFCVDDVKCIEFSFAADIVKPRALAFHPDEE